MYDCGLLLFASCGITTEITSLAYSYAQGLIACSISAGAYTASDKVWLWIENHKELATTILITEVEYCKH